MTLKYVLEYRISILKLKTRLEESIAISDYWQEIKERTAKIVSSGLILIRDMFQVYLNRFVFPFLRVPIIKTNKFCFFLHNGRVPGIAK